MLQLNHFLHNSPVNCHVFLSVHRTPFQRCHSQELVAINDVLCRKCSTLLHPLYPGGGGACHLTYQLYPLTCGCCNPGLTHRYRWRHYKMSSRRQCKILSNKSLTLQITTAALWMFISSVMTLFLP